MGLEISPKNYHNRFKKNIFDHHLFSRVVRLSLRYKTFQNLLHKYATESLKNSLSFVNICTKVSVETEAKKFGKWLFIQTRVRIFHQTSEDFAIQRCSGRVAEPSIVSHVFGFLLF